MFLHGNGSVDHPILVEGSIIESAVFKRELTLAVLEVVDPFALVLRAIRIVESALAVALALPPVADVTVAQELVVRGAIKPDVGAEAALEVVLPVAFVLLVRGQPVHGALAVAQVVLPHALVEVGGGVGHLAEAPLHASLPGAGEDAAVLVDESALAVSETVDPLALVLDAFFRVDVLAFAVAKAVFYLSLIGRSIRPAVTADTRNLVVLELSLVLSAISPLEGPIFAVKQAVLHLAAVSVAIAELASALSMVDLADLVVLLIVDNIARPILDN